MVGCELEPGTTSLCDSFQHCNDVQSSIRITGGLDATIVVSLDREVAFAAAQALIGEKPNSINSDVIDLVGEIANMIGGRAKERLNIPNSLLGLPIPGPLYGKDPFAGPLRLVEQLPFTSPWGKLTLELCATSYHLVGNDYTD